MSVKNEFLLYLPLHISSNHTFFFVSLFLFSDQYLFLYDISQLPPKTHWNRRASDDTTSSSPEFVPEPRDTDRVEVKPHDSRHRHDEADFQSRLDNKLLVQNETQPYRQESFSDW